MPVKDIGAVLDDMLKEIVRRMITVEHVRPDGRAPMRSGPLPRGWNPAAGARIRHVP